MWVGLKQYILHQCWLKVLLLASLAFFSVVRAENLFSCKHQHEYQIVEISQARACESYQRENIPIMKIFRWEILYTYTAPDDLVHILILYQFTHVAFYSEYINLKEKQAPRNIKFEFPPKFSSVDVVV
jgi:hypothetical protein